MKKKKKKKKKKIIFLIIVISDEAWDFSFWYILPSRISAICLTLYRAYCLLSVILSFFASLGLVSMGLICVSVRELSVNFDILLDDDFVTCVLVF